MVLIYVIWHNYIFTHSTNAIIPLSKYPKLEILQENYNVILEELKYILQNKLWSNYDDLHKKDIFRKNDINYVLTEMTKSQSKVEEKTENPKWKIYGLIYNKKSINETFCPQTTKLLQSIPYIVNAGFSCLEPNKTTDEHTDNNDKYYRYQLPLIVPKKNTGFKVDNTSIKYEINKPFIFDDCYKHKAWNNSNEIRVVLICDIDRKN
jgi:beta-hydroxylase